jgi:AcrR family transcriptional regulator
MRAAASKPRRTQEERRAETRGRVLEAALACLAELGYGGTTTTAVAERAGVSRGAQLHHFPTRAALIAAAVEHLYAGLRADYERAFARLSPAADRLGASIDLLWRVWHDPRLTAVIELHVAARTDAELEAALRPVAEAHREHIVRLARRLFPREALAERRFRALLDVVQETLRGMAVGHLVEHDAAQAAHTLTMLKELVAAALKRPAIRERRWKT